MKDDLTKLLLKWNDYLRLELSLNLSRGKPSKEQLDLSLPMMDVLSSNSSFLSREDIDVRNYGVLDGIIECKELMSHILKVPAENIIVFGNSSLNIMYDQISRSFTHGVNGGTPWCKLQKIKWLCPVPGYDRHFSITEHFGIEMINIPMNEEGPDIELIKEYIKDEKVKGIWCVPKFSNPSGIVYSPKIIKQLANLKPAASDFRIYWDNAYSLHYFDKDVRLLNIFEEAKKAKNEDIVYVFGSTSKITFPGSGIAALGCSLNNKKHIESLLKFQTIGHDKINQLRHTMYFKSEDVLIEHMKKHGKILKRKFDIVKRILEENLGGFAKWTIPAGGYFVTIEVRSVAQEVVERCKSCGVFLTPAGSTHPYHNDPSNSFLRLAPSYLNDDDLITALNVLCLAIKIETILKSK